MGCCFSSKDKHKKPNPNENPPIQNVKDNYQTDKSTGEEEGKIEVVNPEHTADRRHSSEQRHLYTLDFPESYARLIDYNITLHKQHQQEIRDTLYPYCGMTEIHDGNLFLAGGIDLARSEDVPYCFMIDIKECDILPLASMRTSKRRLRLLYHENFVYAIGGVREKTVKEQNFRGTRLDYSSSFERYSLASSSWEDLQDLPRGVEYPGCFVLNNSLYVTGGSYISGQDSFIIDSVQIFDLDKQIWIDHSLELPISLYTHMCAELEDDRVLIFGGADEEDDNNYECYIFDGVSFKNVCSLPERATAFPYYSVVFNNEVITFNDENVIFTYSVSSDSWYTTSLNTESVT